LDIVDHWKERHLIEVSLSEYFRMDACCVDMTEPCPTFKILPVFGATVLRPDGATAIRLDEILRQYGLTLNINMKRVILKPDVLKVFSSCSQSFSLRHRDFYFRKNMNVRKATQVVSLRKLDSVSNVFLQTTNQLGHSSRQIHFAFCHDLYM